MSKVAAGSKNIGHDEGITYWELKDVFNFPNGLNFRLSTFRLINNKYETAGAFSSPEGHLSSMVLPFYHQHGRDKESAENYHKMIKDKLTKLSFFAIASSEDQVVELIQAHIPELTRYTNSVPYEYPGDVHGEEYRKNK